MRQLHNAKIDKKYKNILHEIIRHLNRCARNMYFKTGEDTVCIFWLFSKWQSSPEVYIITALGKMEVTENVKPGGR